MWQQAQVIVSRVEESTGWWGTLLCQRVCSCRGTAAAAGLLVRSWNASGEGGAAIVYDWERRMLEAIFEGEGDMATLADLDDARDTQKRVGGDVDMPDDSTLQVRRQPATLTLPLRTCGGSTSRSVGAEKGPKTLNPKTYKS